MSIAMTPPSGTSNSYRTPALACQGASVALESYYLSLVLDPVNLRKVPQSAVRGLKVPAAKHPQWRSVPSFVAVKRPTFR